MSLALTLLANALTFSEPYLRTGFAIVQSRAEVQDADDDLDASGVAFESEAGFDFANERDQLHFEIDADFVDFDNPAFTDRWRFRGEVSWTREWSDTFETRLRVDMGESVPTASFFDTDLLRLRARFQYAPQRAHRARIEMHWREHSYDDGSGSGKGPRLDADYRWRLGRYNYLELETRFESISATDPEREYRRRGARMLFTQPVTDTLRVRPALSYLATDFRGRPADTSGFREDRQWTPAIELLWWPTDWRISAELQYRWRGSTDLSRNIEGTRAALEVAHVF